VRKAPKKRELKFEKEKEIDFCKST